MFCLIPYFFCIFDQSACPASPCKYLTFWEHPWEMAGVGRSTYPFNLLRCDFGDGRVCACVLRCHLGCQWLLSVTALIWQLSGIFFPREEGWSRSPGLGSTEIFSLQPCQGSTTKKDARVSIGTDSPSDRISPFWN